MSALARKEKTEEVIWIVIQDGDSTPGDGGIYVVFASRSKTSAHDYQNAYRRKDYSQNFSTHPINLTDAQPRTQKRNQKGNA